jgi:rRNA maturation endonuclease Nob1
MSEEEKKEVPWIMIVCPKCGQLFGSYLHFCPSCGLKNETEQHSRYWEKKLLGTEQENE